METSPPDRESSMEWTAVSKKRRMGQPVKEPGEPSFWWGFQDASQPSSFYKTSKYMMQNAWRVGTHWPSWMFLQIWWRLSYPGSNNWQGSAGVTGATECDHSSRPHSSALTARGLATWPGRTGGKPRHAGTVLEAIHPANAKGTVRSPSSVPIAGWAT